MPSPTPIVVIEKGAFRSPSTKVPILTLLYLFETMLTVYKQIIMIINWNSYLKSYNCFIDYWYWIRIVETIFLLKKKKRLMTSTLNNLARIYMPEKNEKIINQP